MSIEATNEYRRDFELSENGIVLVGEEGLCNAPKNPKCWYQFGQRIVGWSRIAQHVAMQLVEPYSNAIVCGDTDSFKIHARKRNLSAIEHVLDDMGECIDKARHRVTSRVEQRYNAYYHDMPGIGYYVNEGEYEGFSASWNKSYVALDGGKPKATIAGIPTGRGGHSVNSYMQELMDKGATFAEVCETVIGYNVTFDYSLTLLNGRKHPLWGEFFDGEVTDYQGDTCFVHAPMALAIYPEPKTIGGTDSTENFDNMVKAKENNPNVNSQAVTLYWGDSGIGVEL